jgi:transposase
MANRQVRRRFSEEEMKRGIGMLDVGRTQRHVAHIRGISQNVVSRMWNRFQMTGHVLQGHAGGRKRSTTQAKDRFIVLQAGQAPTVLERYDLT